jgi:hypothetical protein
MIGEGYMKGFGFVGFQAPDREPVMNRVEVVLQVERGNIMVWVRSE